MLTVASSPCHIFNCAVFILVISIKSQLTITQICIILICANNKIASQLGGGVKKVKMVIATLQLKPYLFVHT